MKNPFRRRHPAKDPEQMIHFAKDSTSLDRERDLLAQVLDLQEQNAALADANAELADTNNRRSLRMNKQLETRDLQTPEARMSQLLVQERKLQAVSRLLSGEDIDGETALLKQLGNRLGMSMPTLGRVYGRMDALQSLAPLRDKVRTAMNSIDWRNDVTFEYPEDRDAIESILGTVR